jgi:putative restriction endonuclease
VTPPDLARRITDRPQDAAEVYQRVRSRGIAQVIFRLALLDAYRGGARSAGCLCTPRSRQPTSSRGAPPPPGSGCLPANGLLLCSTRHAMFDAGIFSITADCTITCRQHKVPGHLRMPADQSAAGLDGQPVTLPADPRLWPAAEARAYRKAH